MSNIAGFPPSPNFINALADADAKIKHVDIDLSVARTNVQFLISWTQLFVDQKAYDSEVVISTTLSTGDAFFRRNQAANDAVYLNPGTSFFLGPFTSIWITNTAQANAMIRIYYMSGPQIQPFASEVTVIGALGTSASHGTVGVTNAANGVTIVAANVNRKSVLIVNYSAVEVDLGDATVTTANGIPLAAGTPGGVFSTTTYNGIIHGIAATAGPHDVRFWEETA